MINDKNLTSRSQSALRIVSSKLGSTTLVTSLGTLDTVSRRSKVTTLSLHFGVGEDGKIMSRPLIGGGDDDFEGVGGACDVEGDGEVVFLEGPFAYSFAGDDDSGCDKDRCLDR